MAWQAEVGSGTDRAVDYHDLVVKAVAFKTSQHVATVAVNAGGTGYVVGDVLTLTHAGAFLDARFEVTSVSSGVITGLRIVSSGAFSNRVATVAVNAGGTGYAVNDVVEVQGGTAREKAKAQVTTVAAGVVTGVALFETGGAYSTAPGLTGAATLGVGPAAYAGDDALTLDLTMTGLVGTTGLSVTGGTGSAATVDITLAQTGWSVDGRNTNNYSANGVTNEKQVVLVGDAAGRTNKPYVGFVTATATSGVDTRYGVACFGMAAHNSALPFQQAPGISPGINVGTGALEVGSYIITPQNKAQQVDFWMATDDLHSTIMVNINPGAAATDDGRYLRAYLGYMNSYGTEVENPHPMLVGASSRLINVDETVASTNISGMPECIGPLSSNTGWFYYESEGSVWRNVENGENLATAQKPYIAWPFGDQSRLSDTTDADFIVTTGPITTYDTWSNVRRLSPSKSLLPVPGTTPKHFLWPINILARAGSASENLASDGPRGELRGWFFLTATNSSGNQIANFSEDVVEVGSDRYRIFHNHVHTSRYQYVAIKEAV